MLQGELSSKDDTVKELRRWLDQAQGQLQNTQAALHEREADCKTLAADLKAALAGLAALKVCCYPAQEGFPTLSNMCKDMLWSASLHMAGGTWPLLQATIQSV